MPASAAATGRRKVLVTVFQRGAADGLNVVAPFFEKRYSQLRPGIGQVLDSRKGVRHVPPAVFEDLLQQAFLAAEMLDDLRLAGARHSRDRGCSGVLKTILRKQGFGGDENPLLKYNNLLHLTSEYNPPNKDQHL